MISPLVSSVDGARVTVPAFVRKNRWAGALLILVLAVVLVWQRNVWSNAYNRWQTGRELARADGDYRSVSYVNLERGRVKIRYPFYWSKSQAGGILKLGSIRYTGADCEMIFEPNPVSSGVMERTIRAVPEASEPSVKRDATLSGVPMDLFRYYVGKAGSEGYHLNIVAVFPDKYLKVTIVQRYGSGLFVEDDVATTRMQNVLYGLEF